MLSIYHEKPLNLLDILGHKSMYEILMRLIRKLGAGTLLSLSILYSQVNTEAMRVDNPLPGIQHNLELDFAYISGNTELIELNGSYRADYITNSDWYGFFLWKYDRAFEKPQENFTYKGFGHLRVAKPIMAQLDIEGYVQKEFNHFIDLENRELAGLGLRLNPFKELFLGSGFMSEMEKYQNSSQGPNFIKSTNYFNYTLKFHEIIEIQNIMYYQFKLEEFDDYRILWDGKLKILSLKGVSFHINCHYRYDNNSKNPNYFEISNGLGIQF